MRRDVEICWRARGVIAPQRSERKCEFPATAEVPDRARASGTAADRNLLTLSLNQHYLSTAIVY